MTTEEWKDAVIDSLAKYDAESVDEVYQKGRKDAIDEIQNNIDAITWYRICNGKLVEGASTEDEPLYKYSDIEKMFEKLWEETDDN